MNLEDNIHSLAAPFALDALDDLERRRFEDHLATGCGSCNEEVAGFLEVAAVLGMDEEAPISDDLRAAVTAVPDTVRQFGPPIRAQRTGSWVRRVSTTAAVVLAIATAGLGAAVLDQQQQIGELEQQTAVADILRRPDATITTADSEQGSVRVVTSEQAGEGAVLAVGLADLDDDSTYQLWLIDDEGATSAGFLDVADGAGEQVLAGGVADASAVGVSIEPAGGSESPTTVIAVAEVG